MSASGFGPGSSGYTSSMDTTDPTTLDDHAQQAMPLPVTQEAQPMTMPPPAPSGESAGWGPYTRTQLARYRPDGTVETTWRPGVVAPVGPIPAAIAGMAAVGLCLIGGPLLLLLFVAYLLPTVVAASRRADYWKFDTGQVSLVGILAGWTGIGWVAALIMAVMKDRPAVL